MCCWCYSCCCCWSRRSRKRDPTKRVKFFFSDVFLGRSGQSVVLHIFFLSISEIGCIKILVLRFFGKDDFEFVRADSIEKIIIDLSQYHSSMKLSMKLKLYCSTMIFKIRSLVKYDFFILNIKNYLLSFFVSQIYIKR